MSTEEFSSVVFLFYILLLLLLESGYYNITEAPYSLGCWDY